MDWDALLGATASLMERSVWLGPFAAFAGGALTALNPCVLATIPLIMGFVSGATASAGGATAGGRPRAAAVRQAFLLSLLFVAGLSLELAAVFGLASGAAGLARAAWWDYVVAAVCFALGLHLVGVYRLPALFVPRAGAGYAGPAGALALGFLFGLISLPCTGPVLLLLAALVPALGPARGGVLLFMYGLGHSLLILAAGTSAGIAAALLKSSRLNRATEILRRVSGALIILVGLYVLAW